MALMVVSSDICEKSVSSFFRSGACATKAITNRFMTADCALATFSASLSSLNSFMAKALSLDGYGGFHRKGKVSFAAIFSR